MRYLKRTKSNTRFQDNRDGTVTDTWYSRVWLKSPKFEFPHSMSHDEAIEAAQNCEVGGFSDWELPTPNELGLLLSYSQHDPCLPPDHPFAIESDLYWARNKYAQSFMGGWYASFRQGFITGEMSAFDKGYVWAMRRYDWAAFPPEERFQDHFDGTVTDTWTGLMWLKDPKSEFPNPMTQGEAIEAAQNCNVAGFRDWFVTYANDLALLIDYDQMFPALHDSHPFIIDSEEHYWSLNTYVGPKPPGQHDGWSIYMRDGSVFNTASDNSVFPHHVWPARIA